MFASYASGAPCEKWTWSEFQSRKETLKGQTLIAIASWCSGCKESLLSAQQSPRSTVFLVAFDEPEPVQKVLEKYNFTSKCIYGDDIVKGLKIESLPWKE